MYIDLQDVAVFLILSGISWAVFYTIARVCQWEEDRQHIKKQ